MSGERRRETSQSLVPAEPDLWTAQQRLTAVDGLCTRWYGINVDVDVFIDEVRAALRLTPPDPDA